MEQWEVQLLWCHVWHTLFTLHSVCQIAEYLYDRSSDIADGRSEGHFHFPVLRLCIVQSHLAIVPCSWVPVTGYVWGDNSLLPAMSGDYYTQL